MQGPFEFKLGASVESRPLLLNPVLKCPAYARAFRKEENSRTRTGDLIGSGLLSYVLMCGRLQRRLPWLNGGPCFQKGWYMLVETVGFGPTHTGVKVPCLTAWLSLNIF